MVGVEHDRHPRRDGAPDTPDCPTVDPLGQDPALKAEHLKSGHLLPFGRQPRQAERVEHVVGREEASCQYLPGTDPSVATGGRPSAPRVRLIERARMRQTATDVPNPDRPLRDRHALRDESAHGMAHLLVVATRKARPPRPGDGAAAETGQGDPLGPAALPAEGLRRPVGLLLIGDRRSASRTRTLLARWIAKGAVFGPERQRARRGPIGHDVHLHSHAHGIDKVTQVHGK